MKQFDTWLEKYWKRSYILLILLAVGLYAVLSLDQKVWADEAYTFALIRHSFGEVWQITAADVHPPLYYFLLKLLAAPFGYNVTVCRMLSALPMVMTLALGGWQLGKLFGKRTGILFMGAYLLFPYAMTSAAEVRMYGLAQLFVFLCGLYAYRAYRENTPKCWALFAIFGTCAAYTHYFALVSAGVIYGLLLLALLLKKRQLWKGWCLGSLATILLFLPWLGSFLSQLAYKVNNEYWIEPITVQTLVDYVLTLFSANGLGAFPLFLALTYVLALVLLLREKDEKRLLGLCALAVPVGTLAVGLLASILVRPVFVIRYILPAVPLLVCFFALALSAVDSQALVACLMTVCLMGGLSNGMVVAVDAVTMGDGQISKGYVANLPQYDAFVVYSGNTMHASQELSYCDSETPIYTVDELGPDNPYPNRLPYSDFRNTEENYQRVILVLAQGEPVPESFEDYSATCIGTVYVSDIGQDLWYLEK